MKKHLSMPTSLEEEKSKTYWTWLLKPFTLLNLTLASVSDFTLYFVYQE